MCQKFIIASSTVKQARIKKGLLSFVSNLTSKKETRRDWLESTRHSRPYTDQAAVQLQFPINAHSE